MLVIHRLIWNPWNTAHIARHDVTPAEVDELCKAGPLVQEAYKGRLVASGKTAAGRFLVVILAPRQSQMCTTPSRPIQRAANTAACTSKRKGRRKQHDNEKQQDTNV